MKEVQEKLLPGELGVSPRISLLISPQDWGLRGLTPPTEPRWNHCVTPACRLSRQSLKSRTVVASP